VLQYRTSYVKTILLKIIFYKINLNFETKEFTGKKKRTNVCYNVLDLHEFLKIFLEVLDLTFREM
jgi:hypothetical protein